MKALVLDFDGVLSDSAREAFAVALRAWSHLHPDSRLAESQDDAALYRDFLELMPLGNRAEDYAVALAALSAGERLPDQAAYDAYHRQQSESELQAFHRRFYQERHAWAAADPEGWRVRMSAYPGVPELLRRRADDVALAIATAKDLASVRALLDAYGLRDLFPDARILDKEAGKSKRAHLKRLAGGLALPYPEITFVDDKLNHLEAVAPLGVRCVLAAWGYNGEREQRAARTAGYRVCGLDDFEREVFG